LPLIANDPDLFGFDKPDLIVDAREINDPSGPSSLIRYYMFLLFA
jgi:hypothetical protein